MRSGFILFIRNVNDTKLKHMLHCMPSGFQNVNMTQNLCTQQQIVVVVLYTEKKVNNEEQFTIKWPTFR